MKILDFLVPIRIAGFDSQNWLKDTTRNMKKKTKKLAAKLDNAIRITGKDS